MNDYSLKGKQMAEDPIQEQLIAARQAQILDAAVKVFAEKGYHRATIPDIAKQAKIAVGTIYNYFGKKEDLLLALLHRMNETDQREDNLAMAGEMDLHTFFHSYIQQRYAYMNKEGLEVMRAVLPEVLVNAELRKMYIEQIIEPTFAIAEKHYGGLIEAGKVRPLDVPITLRIISSTFLGLMILRMMDEPVVEERWDEFAGVFTSMILDGLIPR
jgi:TetR/AcrR family transcriptional regulator, fatty acid metabolism regulator protein